jgi:hypothetical protein
MGAVDWLVTHRFESLVHREFDWVFTFNDDVHLTVACLWRLLENGRIRFTSSDDGQKFGLPAPVDAASEVNDRIRGAHVKSIDLQSNTLDLVIVFSTSHVLEVIPDSSGYEAWQICHHNLQLIAVGGGDLKIFGNS